jgi:hypothetical protein
MVQQFCFSLVHTQMHLFDIDIPGKITFKDSDTLSPGNDVTVVNTGEPTSGLTGRLTSYAGKWFAFGLILRSVQSPFWRWSDARFSAAEAGALRFRASFFYLMDFCSRLAHRFLLQQLKSTILRHLAFHKTSVCVLKNLFVVVLESHRMRGCIHWELIADGTVFQFDMHVIRLATRARGLFATDCHKVHVDGPVPDSEFSLHRAQGFL